MVRASRSRRSYYHPGYETEFPAYVPVAARQERAAAAASALKKKGESLSPVEVRGRAIAATFWGKAWCTNLERYSDFSNRLPRGRTYVRNGSVIDLRIEAGEVKALVQGSSLYRVTITVQEVEPERWKAIAGECAGKIESVVELLGGKLSSRVMEVITRQESGLFPAPAHIGMRCSCPDWATMCKHVAAVLYGIGARLDQRPELLFELRGANPAELIAEVASGGIVRAGQARVKDKVLTGADLSSLFGIDIEEEEEAPAGAAAPLGKPAAAAKARAMPAGAAAPFGKPVAGAKAPATPAGAAPLGKPVAGAKAPATPAGAAAPFGKPVAGAKATATPAKTAAPAKKATSPARLPLPARPAHPAAPVTKAAPTKRASAAKKSKTGLP